VEKCGLDASGSRQGPEAGSWAFERWETKIINREVTPQAIWRTAKSLMKRNGPKTPTAIHGPSGLKFLPPEKARVTTDCLGNQFTPHDLCDEHHERGWRLESKPRSTAPMKE